MAWSRVRAIISELCRLGETALDLVVPRTCPGCYSPGSWCERCAGSLAAIPRSVAVSDAAYDEFYRRGLSLPSIHALARYHGPVRKVIIAGKEHGRRDLPSLVGAALGVGLRRLRDMSVLAGDLWLVPAPTRPAAARARGGDPVLSMVRSAARVLARGGEQVGVAPCLTLGRGVRDSVGLSAAGRAANLIGKVRFDAAGAPPRGARVVLIDDVFTTGTTVIASMLALRERGITVAGVLVVASASPLNAATLPKSHAVTDG